MASSAEAVRAMARLHSSFPPYRVRHACNRYRALWIGRRQTPQGWTVIEIPSTRSVTQIPSTPDAASSGHGRRPATGVLGEGEESEEELSPARKDESAYRRRRLQLRAPQPLLLRAARAVPLVRAPGPGTRRCARGRREAAGRRCLEWRFWCVSIRGVGASASASPQPPGRAKPLKSMVNSFVRRRLGRPSS